MITSTSNPKIKLVRSLARRKDRYAAKQFVVEGVRSVEEAVAAQVIPAVVLYTASAQDDVRTRALLDRLRALTSELFDVSDAVMKEISATETPQGILAIAPFIESHLPPQPQFILILDSVRDPGNVGTILRSARAAGVELVFFAPNTADPYNDKVVRSAMGAHFAVPFRIASWEQIAQSIRSIPRIYLADANGDLVYSKAKWTRPVALIVGGEAEGASDAAKRIATARVSIPMHGGAESLNAAMAATVLLFQATQV
jgi:TrmH family RNA methyltransferase